MLLGLGSGVRYVLPHVIPGIIALGIAKERCPVSVKSEAAAVFQLKNWWQVPR
jgi:hypothetical protein